ncbi:IS30 family transposase [Pseudonocardia nematodicida]
MAGPPRYPRAQWRAFWRARLAGADHETAVAAAGVSATAGRKWIRECGGVVPDLVEPSGRYLSADDRETISNGFFAGESYARIAQRIGRHRSTVSREIRRNRTLRREALPARADGRPHPRGPVPGSPRRTERDKIRYRGWHAQSKAEERARRPKTGKLGRNPRLRGQVQDWLDERWSPEQIARQLRVEFAEEPEMWVSHETIYKALFMQGRGELRRELHRCLRTGRALRKPQRFSAGRGGSQIPDKVMISERPAEVDDRAVPGHWEGDLIIGKDGRTAIGTLVERSTRFVMLLHLPGQAQPAPGARAEQVRDALTSAIGQMPEILRRSLTWDQGLEMSRHRQVSEATGIEIYFCDPHSPWQRGSNENTNGLLRQYFPKGTDLSQHTAHDLEAVAIQLNGRPHKTLDWRTPAEALNELLSNQSGVATTP